MKQSFRKCYGGDLMWLSHILGLTGPKGKYFCNDCLVTRQELLKGSPHSPVVLPKYQTLAGKEVQDFAIRDFESITENSTLFTQSGCKVPSNY